MINIYNPNIEKYTEEAKKAIESGWISNHGEYINLATNKLSEILGCYSILLSNKKFKFPRNRQSKSTYRIV